MLIEKEIEIEIEIEIKIIIKNKKLPIKIGKKTRRDQKERKNNKK